MNYFAYGSNMSIARLRERVPRARKIGCCYLESHKLRFHKLSDDGSGKCNALYTGGADRVYGVLYDIMSEEKPALDQVEGLGFGYREASSFVINDRGDRVAAFFYSAIRIDNTVKPYSWYLNHVLVGARASGLPESYIRKLEQVAMIEDLDSERESMERAIYK